MTLTLAEFGQKLREYLGHSHEGTELTLVDVADFFTLYLERGLSFNEWIMEVQK